MQHVWVNPYTPLDSLERVIRQVETASFIVFGLSSTFHQSAEHRLVVEYATQLKKPCLFLWTEDKKPFNIPEDSWISSFLPQFPPPNPWTHARGYHVGFYLVLEKILGATQATTIQPKAPAWIDRTWGDNPLSEHYCQAVIPPEKPLSAAELALEAIERWDTGEVCQWLRMNGLEDLLAPFVWHGIKGSSLLMWGTMPPEDFDDAWERLQIRQVGLALRFRFSLDKLLFPHSSREADPKLWSKGEVGEWLRKAGLEGAAAAAVKDGWDGMVLHGIFNCCERGLSPSLVLDPLGIRNSLDHFRLLSCLSQLFGSV